MCLSSNVLLLWRALVDFLASFRVGIGWSFHVLASCKFREDFRGRDLDIDRVCD